MSSIWLNALLEALEEFGLDAAALCRAALVDRSILADPETRVPRDVGGRIWRAALKASRDPLLGIHAGAQVQIRVNHVVPLLLMSAATFREGVDVALRFQELLAHARVVTVEGTPASETIRLHKMETVLAVLDEEIEYMAAVLLRVFRAATAASFTPERMHFAHRALGPVAEYERVFGCPVAFGQAHTEFFIGAENWERRLRHHSASLQAQFRLMAAEAYEASNLAQAGAASRAIRALLPTGRSDVDSVAAAMHTSSRTLQRRLGEEGTTFREVLDTTRRRIVIDCLERGCATEDVLRLAGFSDTRALRRAIRRWEVGFDRGAGSES